MRYWMAVALFSNVVNTQFVGIEINFNFAESVTAAFHDHPKGMKFTFDDVADSILTHD